MSRERIREHLGAPDLKIAGFQLWVHGPEFPGAVDPFDADWLRVTAHCGAAGASIWVEGAIVTVTDIAGLGRQCDAVLRGEASSAVLDPREPELRLCLQVVGRLGHIGVEVEITPDHLAQRHTMELGIDQSDLPGIIEQCSAIVRQHPVR